MQAIRLHEFGPATNLVLDDLPDLSPADGQVRVAVEASGVHLVDTTIRRGEPGPFPSPELPTIPGREVAGVVDQVGRRRRRDLGRPPGGRASRAGAGGLRRTGGHRRRQPDPRARPRQPHRRGRRARHRPDRARGARDRTAPARRHGARAVGGGRARLAARAVGAEGGCAGGRRGRRPGADGGPRRARRHDGRRLRAAGLGRPGARPARWGDPRLRRRRRRPRPVRAGAAATGWAADDVRVLVGHARPASTAATW